MAKCPGTPLPSFLQSSSGNPSLRSGCPPKDCGHDGPAHSRLTSRRLPLPGRPSWCRSRFIDAAGPGRRPESGATLTEVAIVLVLLISLIFGIIEGGRLLWDYSALANATTEGVRWAAVRSGKSKQPASETDIKNQVVTMAVGLGVSTSDVTVSVIDPDGNTLAWNSTNAVPVSVVKVGVQYTFTPAILNLYPLGGITLSNSSQMMIAR